MQWQHAATFGIGNVALLHEWGCMCCGAACANHQMDGVGGRYTSCMAVIHADGRHIARLNIGYATSDFRVANERTHIRQTQP